ncbi:hypothetical protein [Alkaliphilus oremlandii]|uniref:MOSC domain-containing protein n=1 Tax=Alkaliphilus oremlandii (strain OhILAs) TaxID=350688 RepID=A8MLW6_ALKOO|nr:hypothetical protein [Alkaliphilus oremlandii]ABW18133.1 hypothetical protein Clos_0571 [Alkaliphilus oremlandii OhILAs]
MAKVKSISFKENNGWTECNHLYLDASKLKESKGRISFITQIGQERLLKDEMKGFCHQRFKANFVVREMEIKDLVVDMQLRVGDTIVSIIQVGKACLLECPIIEASNPSCFVNRQVFFGAIIREGLVKKEDAIHILD